MPKQFKPSPAALRAALAEFPDGCCTMPYQVINLRHAFVLGYDAARKAARKRRAQPQTSDDAQHNIRNTKTIDGE